MIFRTLIILLINYFEISYTLQKDHASEQLNEPDLCIMLFINNSILERFDIEENKTINIDTFLSSSLYVLPTFTRNFINNVLPRYKNFEYFWEKNSKLLTDVTKKRVIHRDLIPPFFEEVFAQHFFENITPFDSANYSITFKGSPNLKKIIYLKIGVKSTPLIEFIDYKPVNLDALNQNWTATAEVYLYPEGNITWHFIPCENLMIQNLPKCDDGHDTYKIEHNIKYNSSFYFINSTVNFQPKKSGILTCTGTNKLGNITKSINILLDDEANVFHRIEIRTIPDGNITNIKDIIILKCSCLSFYHDLEWYSVEKKSIIKSTEDQELFKINNELENSISLRINNVKLSDKGLYECRCYKDLKNTIYNKEIINLQVREKIKNFWSTDFIYIVISVLVVIILITFYLIYLNKIKEKPWTLLYDEKYEFPVDRIKIESELGSGAFGVVFEAIAEGILPNEKETTVAVKTIKKSSANESTLRALESELEILLKLGKHLNIINLLGTVTKSTQRYRLMVIVEFCKLGNLKSFIFDNKISFRNEMNFHTGTIDNVYNEVIFSTNTLIFWAYQIAKGMEYVSLINILHGDLAARNILICDHNIVKICDFGLAKSLNYHYNYQAKGSTPLPIRWLAIETLECGIMSTFSDVWSFGILVWELFSLCNDPYRRLPLDRFVMLEQLSNGYRLEKPKFSNNEIYQIMVDCWEENPKERPSFTLLVQKFENILATNASEAYTTLTNLFEEQIQLHNPRNIERKPAILNE